MQYPVFWALFAIFLLTYVFPFIVTLLRLLRWEIKPIHVRRDATIPALTPLQQAGADELAALGFEPVCTYESTDDYDTYRSMLLKHRTEAAFANIDFRANPFTGYPVWFWSFRGDGTSLVTGNRQPLYMLLPGVDIGDPYAETLELHWKFHESRIRDAGVVALEGKDAFSRLAAAIEDGVTWSLSNKTLVEQAGKLFFSFRAALRMTIEAMRRRKELRKPYKGAVLGDTHRSAYYAELYTMHETARKRLKYRIDVAVILLILSFAVSFGLFSWWMGWRFASAVLIVLTVHEFGHAIVMRFFGYKDMSMFFIPFAGAVVMGDIKAISVWQQTIVLLAGPVPGLIFGIWVLVHPALFPPGTFMQLLALNAAVLNIFNLLPLSFLDGGKLLEIAFLSRWPYALFVFSLISCLGMFWLIISLKSYNMWVVGFVMAMATRALWRIAGLRKDWAKQSDDKKELKDLFYLAGQRLKSKSFNRQYFMVRSVYEKPVVNPPRWWETALALSLFVCTWAGSVSVAWSFWHH